jgi:dTDP-4-amino-4,6-dideoxygalactose transaminase
MQKIWLSTPHFEGNELHYIAPLLQGETTDVAGNVLAFERQLAAYFDLPDVVALSSGTAAIHLALLVLGVGATDEVLCSSFTFAGSANPITYVGAQPIFIDSDPETWNICPIALQIAIKDRLRIGRKPRAAVVVHGYGMPAQIDKIMEICQKYNIPVIEDAAEALGSSYQNKKLGSWGDMGILSFNVNKIITTMGGGALLSKNENWVQQARTLANQAREPAPHYEHTKIGYNYRLSAVNAGIGLGQLEVLHDRVAQRRAVFEYYKNNLADIESIVFLDENTPIYGKNQRLSNYWLTSMLINNPKYNAEYVRQKLWKAGIEARPLWKPLHLQPIFAHLPFYSSGLGNGLSNDVAQRYFDMGLSLPSSSSLRHEDLGRICGIIRDILG